MEFFMIKKIYVRLIKFFTMKKLPFYSLYIAIILFISACNGNNDSEIDTGNLDTTIENNSEKKVSEAKKIYYSIPSPSEMADLLKSDGAVYKFELLNDPKNSDKYAGIFKQALNLGIYGADLNYANVYERTHESMLFMRSTRTLAEKLGIENSVSDATITRAEENVDNKDSMMVIINDMFIELDSYLMENDKQDMSALIIAGGWLEGLYLATQTVNEKKPNQKMLDRIAEQKYSLEHLMHFLDQYNKNENVKPVIADMAKINEIYKKVTITRETGEVETDNEGVTTIGGNNKIDMSFETFLEIKKTAKEIRDSYIKY